MGRILALALALSLSGCGAPSGDVPPTRDAGSVSGNVVDALIINGKVSVYAFEGGQKGALLGAGVTDGAGYYSVSITAADQPILVEVTGGYYIEEASGVRVDLSNAQFLQALAMYTSGERISVYATPLTHMAVALAKYRIAHGYGVVDAITTANSQVSALAGFNIVETKPLDITATSSASAYVSPGIQYGFLLAAVSGWTKYASEYNNAYVHTTPFNSITFAQLMADDAASDGLLDGYVLDAAGKKLPVSMGALVLGPDVYRHALAVQMIRMADNSVNKTMISPSQLADAARIYNDNTSGLYDSKPLIAFSEGGPTASFTQPSPDSWSAGTITATFSFSDVLGYSSAQLLLDGTVLANFSPGVNKSFTYNIDTTQYKSAMHTLSLSGMNWAGEKVAVNRGVGFDNTKPQITSCHGTIYIANNKTVIYGTWIDVGAGALQYIRQGNFYGTAKSDGTWSFPARTMNDPSLNYPIEAPDLASNALANPSPACSWNTVW